VILQNQDTTLTRMPVTASRPNNVEKLQALRPLVEGSSAAAAMSRSISSSL
jgi:hypothetical protein